jgi:hypothetical protein
VASLLARERHLAAHRFVVSPPDDGVGTGARAAPALSRSSLDSLAVRAAEQLGVVFLDEVDKLARPGRGGRPAGAGAGAGEGGALSARARRARRAAAERAMTPQQQEEARRQRRAARRRAERLSAERPAAAYSFGSGGGNFSEFTGHSHGNKGEGVQKELLSLIEGTSVKTAAGPVDTTHILFVAAGAFHVSRPEDLLPELRGRLPLRVDLAPLGAASLRRVLAAGESSLLRQHAALLATEGLALEVTVGAVRALAEAAVTLNGRDPAADAETDAVDAALEAAEAAAADALAVHGRWQPQQAAEGAAAGVLAAADAEARAWAGWVSPLYRPRRLTRADLGASAAAGAAAPPRPDAAASTNTSTGTGRSASDAASGVTGAGTGSGASASASASVGAGGASSEDDIGARRLQGVVGTLLERVSFEAPGLVARATAEWALLRSAAARQAAAEAVGDDAAAARAAAEAAEVCARPWAPGLTPARPAAGAGAGAAAGPPAGAWITVTVDEAFVARELNPLLEDIDFEYEEPDKETELKRYLL